MKHITLLSLVALLIVGNIKAQETIKDLSKKAYKGYLYDVDNSNNQLSITYKIPAEKKNGDALFEMYKFDKDNKFLSVENIAVSKETKPDIKVAHYYAYVGGFGFDALGSKLKLGHMEVLKSWSHEKQKYIVSKVITDEVVKPKSENGKTFKGHASFVTTTAEDQPDDLFILAANESRDKTQGTIFYVLNITNSLDIKDMPVDLKNPHTLVYCNQLKESKDIVMIFAPEKGSGDVTNYTYFRYSQKGEFKNKIEFKSPSSNLLITNVDEAQGSVFFCGTSTNSTQAYNDVFSEYVPINNPGYTQEGNNKLDLKWLKSSNEKMNSFHLLKFTGNQLAFATTAPIDDFKSKFVTSGKGASVYKGKKFQVQKFYITPNQEYLVAGQLTGSTNLGLGNPVRTYEDLVCLYFDKAGQLKTQFGLGKMNNDKKSEIFDMVQDFHLAKDGKTIYWEIREVKGVKGYQSFLNAYAGGSPSLYPVYFPRIAKLNLTNTTISDAKILGDEKFFLRKDFPGFLNPAENSITYIGHDEDFKKLWLGKYVFE